MSGTSVITDRERELQRGYSRKWRERNVEKARASYRKAAKKLREERPQELKLYKKRNYLMRRYGLTEEAFRALLRGQGDKCAICVLPDRDWVVDHDHRTGAVRGILCRQCNLGLGGFRDSPDSLMNAARYLMVN